MYAVSCFGFIYFNVSVCVCEIEMETRNIVMCWSRVFVESFVECVDENEKPQHVCRLCRFSFLGSTFGLILMSLSTVFRVRESVFEYIRKSNDTHIHTQIRMDAMNFVRESMYNTATITWTASTSSIRLRFFSLSLSCSLHTYHIIHHST